ncbi:MAG: hypothetical protein JXB49_07310 [Bacteroidales bacterium]|nr:hypothetical protein [Bacteroidales bacterium]MBN2821022.1 hypothetical protein [Bacteroidales bacterium]
MLEVRSQNSEFRIQKSEVRSQKYYSIIQSFNHSIIPSIIQSFNHSCINLPFTIIHSTFSILNSQF